MEKSIDVIRKVLELSDTCQQAIEHIKSMLNEGAFDQTTSLMSDTFEGFYQLEKALPSLKKQLSDHNIESLVLQLKQSFEQVVSAYEQGRRGLVQERIQFNLQPTFHNLHGELESILRPYTLS
ncbi:hypothetical protein PA598K_04734 [Paenibacillus sp. 598K]|uniref:hypothetical protein n=1 Tax=Paenibacillus sp. 598K TaxID=1117987 RepID=UPI000FF99C14|nr:hypothetical protein [Paenibacillus sp. 598K]GBF76279.1 hypothetical protein PA598K_04734 [Paenibacillus sp. 598K]